MLFKRPVSDKVRLSMHKLYPLIECEHTLDNLVDHVCVAGLLTGEPSDSAVCYAAASLAWSLKRKNSLRPITSDDQQLPYLRVPAQQEFASLVEFPGHQGAAALACAKLRGDVLSFRQATFLAMMQLHRGLHNARMQLDHCQKLPTMTSMRALEAEIRQRCRVPATMPLERFLVVIQDYVSLSQRREHRASVLQGEGGLGAYNLTAKQTARFAAEGLALEHIFGDKRAVDLFIKRHQNEPLTTDEQAHLDAALAA